MFPKALLGFEKKRDPEEQWRRGSFAGLGCMDKGMENREDMVPFIWTSGLMWLHPGMPVSRKQNMRLGK